MLLLRCCTKQSWLLWKIRFHAFYANLSNLKRKKNCHSIQILSSQYFIKRISSFAVNFPLPCAHYHSLKQREKNQSLKKVFSRQKCALRFGCYTTRWLTTVFTRQECLTSILLVHAKIQLATIKLCYHGNSLFSSPHQFDFNISEFFSSEKLNPGKTFAKSIDMLARSRV